MCIVTGGNTGIGWGTSHALVTRGAHVILACLDKAGAEDAAQVSQQRFAASGKGSVLLLLLLQRSSLLHSLMDLWPTAPLQYFSGTHFCLYHSDWE